MRFLIVGAFLILTGCATESPKPVKEKNQCESALSLISDPYATFFQKMIAYDVLKANCIKTKPAEVNVSIRTQEIPKSSPVREKDAFEKRCLLIHKEGSEAYVDCVRKEIDIAIKNLQ
jgi:hypothetical protein